MTLSEAFEILAKVERENKGAWLTINEALVTIGTALLEGRLTAEEKARFDALPRSR